MRLIYFIILFVIFASCNLFPGNLDSTKKNKTECENALLFQLAKLPDSPVSQLNGGLGCIFYISNNSALRFILGFGYNQETADKPQGYDYDQVTSTGNLSFMPSWRYNFSSNSTVIAYMGFEGFIEYSNIKIDGMSFKSLTKSTTTYSFGTGIFVGTEFFPLKNVSLSAEYELLLKYSSGSSTITSGALEQTNYSPSSIGIGLNTSKVNLILSCYF